MQLRQFVSWEALSAALAERLAGAFAGTPGAAIMLSGGHAPRPAYALLGAGTPRPAVGSSVYYSDERYVPATSDASNYRASLPLLRAFDLSEPQVLRVHSELPLAAAAADYERQLRELCSAQARLPLGLLGLGADGHTASLFSHADLERAGGHLAIAVQRPDGMSAVTATPEVFARIETVLMVVVGAEKRAALAALLDRDPASIAWRALEHCRQPEVWCESQT